MEFLSEIDSSSRCPSHLLPSQSSARREADGSKALAEVIESCVQDSTSPAEGQRVAETGHNCSVGARLQLV